MIRRCEGPAGEPGWQVVDGDRVSECFIFDPADPMSKLRAEAQLIDAHKGFREDAAAR